jgi:flavonol synthase
MEIKRVQTLAFNYLKELPPQFIRSDNERPENTKALEGVNVPIISLSQPHNLLVNKITEAASEWGFFVITDHDISPKLIQSLQNVGNEFFSLPQKEKEAYANDPSSGKFEGYGTKMTKNLEEKVEWLDYYFHLMSPPSKVDYEMWPKIPSSYRYEVTTIETVRFRENIFV